MAKQQQQDKEVYHIWRSSPNRKSLMIVASYLVKQKGDGEGAGTPTPAAFNSRQAAWIHAGRIEADKVIVMACFDDKCSICRAKAQLAAGEKARGW